MSDRRRTWLGLSTLCLLALLAVLIGLSVGYAIDPANPNRPTIHWTSLHEVLAALLGDCSESAINIVRDLRLPRVLLCAAVGCGFRCRLSRCHGRWRWCGLARAGGWRDELLILIL